MSDAGEDAAVKAAFGCWFGLERGSCAVLLALYRAATAPLNADVLAREVASTPGAEVNHHIHRLRQALNPEAIDYLPAEGYALTPEGVAECRAALWQVGEDLRRAG